jgi:hypothetical protein
LLDGKNRVLFLKAHQLGTKECHLG